MDGKCKSSASVINNILIGIILCTYTRRQIREIKAEIKGQLGINLNFLFSQQQLISRLIHYFSFLQAKYMSSFSAVYPVRLVAFTDGDLNEPNGLDFHFFIPGPWINQMP